MEAFKFNRIQQKEKQTFTEFETELRTQLQYCEFECASCKTSYAERMLLDRIVIGVADKKLQLKLLDGKQPSLSKIIETCKIFEAASANKLLLDRQSVSQSVNAIANVSNEGAQTVAATSAASKTTTTSVPTCYNCGQSFTGKHRQFCPAKNIKCNNCGRIGHFQRYCRSAGANATKSTSSGDNKNNNSTKKINSVDEWGNSGKILRINLIRNDNCKHDCKCNSISNRLEVNRIRWTKQYVIQDWPIKFKIDSGSDANCIPIKFIRKIKVPFQTNCNCDVIDYSSNKVKIYGQVKLNCFDAKNQKSYTAEFLIVDDCYEPILGLESSIEFGLIKRIDTLQSNFPSNVEEFVKQNKDIFDGIGKIPGKCSITLKENSVPTVHYKKRFPLSLHDKLKNKLEQLEKGGIIVRVDGPSDWLNNLQIVEKSDNDIRCCLDPKPLNKCIKREHFLIPTVDDILSRLTGKRVFTVLDLCNGFWHMELDESSSYLTTFITPFGRYRWLRFPFGIISAPEVFQKEMVKIFADIPGVEVYFDDICISGETQEDHDRALSQVIERARVNNIKFNSKKIQYRGNGMIFMGQVINAGVVQPNIKHKKAITNMPKPQNKSDVMRLLGLFKYLARFIPNLSARTAALRELTRNDVEWNWTQRHSDEVNDLLKTITSEPVLLIFDPKLSITIQTDSSKDGLGCVLLQNDQPIAFASRTLSKSEQKWAQIEKELLAIVFACERFHYYLYGREFNVHSDHKPLETLVKRDIDDVTPRLQRMFMQLLKYPSMTITYKPGKEMLVADCLSRAPLKDTEEFDSQTSMMIHSLVKKACFSKENFDNYVLNLKEDERYTRIVKYVESEWPSYHQLDDFCQQFHKWKHELHYERGILFKDHRIVIPTKMQNSICKWLHGPHLGIEKTLARARMQFFWPGMTNDITELVKSCTICEKFTRNNQKEPLVQETPAHYPFHKVSTDIYEYAGHGFIVLIDAYSGFIMSQRLKEKSSRHVIGVIDQIFCIYGYPTEIKSDNVPFNSREFEAYANKTNITMKFSSPRYPQSNGLAEKGVAIAKNLIKRCYEAGETDKFQYRIMEYNSTPVAGMGISPSQLFFGRLIRSRLPIDESLLVRNNIPEEKIQDKIKSKQRIQKYYYDKHSKSLPVLNVGDKIIFKKTGKEWHYGKVVRKVNDRSYIIVDNYSNHWRRNRKFIVNTNNDDFNTSDVLYEMYTGSDNSDKFILMPQPSAELSNHSRSANDVNAPNTSVGNDSADQYHSLDNSINSSLDDEIHVQNESQTTEAERLEPNTTNQNDRDVSGTDDVPTTHSTPYRTRCGRTVRPPKKYGFD